MTRVMSFRDLEIYWEGREEGRAFAEELATKYDSPEAIGRAIKEFYHNERDEFLKNIREIGYNEEEIVKEIKENFPVLNRLWFDDDEDSDTREKDG